MRSFQTAKMEARVRMHILDSSPIDITLTLNRVIRQDGGVCRTWFENGMWNSEFHFPNQESKVFTFNQATVNVVIDDIRQTAYDCYLANINA
jgi:hypothetical protein